MSCIGVVVIGRNEGERLRRCLTSVADHGLVLVYVDSGSRDGSLELAHGLGVEVVELDLSKPFSAARVRNEGLERLIAIAPDVRYVQFVDGDCEVVDGWIDRAAANLTGVPKRRPSVAVYGNCHPDQSVYNRLADLEWETRVGETKACGGIAMMRVAALQQVGGFNSDLIAGEEPELCVRFRQQGWKIFRIDAEMALHDMAMTRFRQWWRTVRTGHAFAEGRVLHGRPPENHYVRETRSIIVWGFVVPLLALGFAWPTHGASLLLFTGYLLLFQRVYRYYRVHRGWRPDDARTFTCFVILGKFANALGLRGTGSEGFPASGARSSIFAGWLRRKPRHALVDEAEVETLIAGFSTSRSSNPVRKTLLRKESTRKF